MGFTTHSGVPVPSGEPQLADGRSPPLDGQREQVGGAGYFTRLLLKLLSLALLQPRILSLSQGVIEIE